MHTSEEQQPLLQQQHNILSEVHPSTAVVMTVATTVTTTKEVVQKPKKSYKKIFHDCLCNKATVLRLSILFTLITTIVLLFVFLPVHKLTQQFIEWMSHLHWYIGFPVFIAMYICFDLFFIPGTILNLGAGFIYGLPVGLCLVFIGQTCGCALAFLLGKRFFKYWADYFTENFQKLYLLEKALSNNGWKIILLLRISPIMNYSLLNYGLSTVKDIRFRHYLIATMIGMIPGISLYVYLGSAAKNLSDIMSSQHQSSITQRIIFGGGLVITVISVIAITVVATRAIKKELKKGKEEQERLEATTIQTVIIEGDSTIEKIKEDTTVEPSVDGLVNGTLPVIETFVIYVNEKQHDQHLTEGTPLLLADDLIYPKKGDSQ